ncbi:serine protease inhibitor [Sphaerochaeta pleomorpha str. Grapes]|uniref:Serine protease inhibitor n=1 Tax=Sphaerochaeta pleomorpha (strain ATCC BAA-1885 / DSM 22778 / Grapes) TaxID=158190 RepID=G8QT20_SPHPG|nr:serpin family protein [Sphaerochaeta pleomorpha]AEV27925.1 serine protease inhibitor [Sphaerochaeta pleomorpha str. Grapes]
MKRMAAFIFFISVTSLLLGSGSKDTEKIMGTPQILNPVEVPASYFKDSVNQFSDSLFLASSKQVGNLLVSPISVFLALGMTANGAGGQTKDAMLKVLTKSEYPLLSLNEKSKSYLASIAALDDSITMDIANSLWLHKEIKADPQFLQSNTEFFGASVQSLDFSRVQSVDTINRWVNDSTKGAIDSILDSIDPGMAMYLINAIYFKADWRTPFERSNTRENIFHTPTGTITTPFMYRNGSFLYSNVDESQLIVLPYKNERFVFFALLPASPFTVRQWLQGQSDASFCGLLVSMIDESIQKQIELSIPKFIARYKTSVSDSLKSMGMSIAFDSQLADFSLMTENKTKDLVLDEILHKTFIRVDEKGSEAAAVTAVMMKATSMPIQSMPLVFDRPFVYGIMDRQEGIPLFLGILDNPTGQ